MADEGRKTRNDGEVFYQVDSTVAPFEVRQGPTGLAEVFNSSTAGIQNISYRFETNGEFDIPKTSGIVILKGGRVYFDHSTNTATFKAVSDRDFYLGRAVQDSASTGPVVRVALNEDPPYDIDLARDGFQSVLVGTPAAGGFGYPINLGGSLIFELTATSEAQKVDALSIMGFSKDANTIVEGAFRVLSDGASGSQDVTIGAASGTHGSDFQSVAAFVALHLDGNVTTINAQSDDTSTDVDPVTTATTYTEGADLASRKEFWLDFRNPNDVQVYIEAALVADATTFTLAAYSGTLFLVVHVEKASGTDVYKLAVDWLRSRNAEQ